MRHCVCLESLPGHMLICTTHPPKTHVWPAKLTVFKKTPPDLPLDDFDGYNADHNGSAEGVDCISKP